MLKRLLVRDRSGGIMVEAAVILPILLFAMLGGVEITRFALLQQKLSRASASMADLVAQAEEITVAEVDNLFSAVQFVVAPFDFANQGRIIVSSVSASDGNAPVVDWQRSGAGAAAATSDLGAPGQGATLPTGFIVRDGESVIFAELVFDFQPLLFSQLVPAQRLEYQAMFRPRFGALQTLIP